MKINVNTSKYIPVSKGDVPEDEYAKLKRVVTKSGNETKIKCIPFDFCADVSIEDVSRILLWARHHQIELLNRKYKRHLWDKKESSAVKEKNAIAQSFRHEHTGYAYMGLDYLLDFYFSNPELIDFEVTQDYFA